MKAHFLALHPLFGTKNNRKSLGYQERSPYYWWWAYLKRNKAYLECCKKNGKTDLQHLYEKFGDVRDDDFRVWWSKDSRGQHLFSEKPNGMFVKELTNKDEWDDKWTSAQVMVVTIPLNQPIRQVNKAFTKLLRDRKNPKRGRTAEKLKNSSAQFPLSRSTTTSSLGTALLVYDTYTEAKSQKKKMTLWEIGNELNLIRKQKLHPSDTPATARDKKNVLAAVVSRYLKQAEESIANTSLGVFP